MLIIGESGLRMTFAGKESNLFTGSNRFDWHDIRYMLADNEFIDIPNTVITEEDFILTLLP